MKKQIRLLIYLCITSIIVSCSDREEELETIPSENHLEIHLEQGKFSFSSKQDLANQIENLKKEPRDYVEKTFENFYKQGFLPLEPIINSNNYALFEDIKSKKEQKSKNSKTYVDITNLIGDKAFASFINYDGEIVVDGVLYKFTPKGLFFGDLKQSEKVKKVALKESKRAESFRNICEQRSIEGGISEVEPGVNRFIAPIDVYDDCGGGGGSGGSGGSSSSSGNAKNDRTALFEKIKNLEVVTPEDNWFQNIFGTYRYAHKYFNDKDYRFELDYHNQRFLIYRSMGLEAETHEEGWFWWNNVKSDEIILGINKIHAVITDLPRPKIETLTINDVFPNSNPRRPVYIHNDSFKIENNGIYDPVSIKVLANKGVPYFKYNDAAILNIYVGDLLGYTVDKEFNYNVLSDSNIRQVYKLGVDYFKKFANSQRKDFFVTVQKSQTEVDLFYFNEFKRKYNTDAVQRNIVSEFAGQVSAEVIDGELKTDWKKTIKELLTGEAFYGKYKFKELDFYGIARRGNEWKGLQIKRLEK